MAIEIIEKRIPSSDGEHELAGKVYLPEGQPKGLFHVVHGMTEHIGRYDEILRAMAADGFVAFGFDHLGHGHTVRDQSELGFIAVKDGWRRLVDDVAVAGKAMKETYGADLPYVLMGHSMGSFVVRLAAKQYDLQDKLIVMGTGGPNAMSGPGLALANLIKALRGPKHVSILVEALAFGRYNSHFDKDDWRNWLSTDPAERKKGGEDPLCNFHFTVSAMSDLVRLQRESNKRRWFNGINKQKPVLLLSGSDDPVGSYSKGVRIVNARLKAAGVPVQMKLYKGFRHEILNDFCRGEVIADIRRFVEE
ncbi:MAG: alpha/beta fold hydrolase [Acutalibacteraceae bacterium]|jgi:alpha-beta hydrolase superfamily lysophospholipase